MYEKKLYYIVNNVLPLYLDIIIGKRACRFPGDPNNGRVTPVKFLYELGDRILIQVSYCDNPLNFIYCYSNIQKKSQLILNHKYFTISVQSRLRQHGKATNTMHGYWKMVRYNANMFQLCLTLIMFYNIISWTSWALSKRN